MENVISSPPTASLTDVIKGMEGVAAEQKKRVTALCNSVFDYERERIFNGDPTQAELRHFASILKDLRALAEGLGEQWLIDRLSFSIETLENPMTAAQAESFLATHLPG